MADSRQLLETVGSDAEELIVFSYPNLPESLGPKGQQLFSEYVEKYGAPQGMNIAFLTSMLAFDALRRAVISGDEVKTHLYSNSFGGELGSFSFDENGDIEGINYILKQVRNGKFEPVDFS